MAELAGVAWAEEEEAGPRCGLSCRPTSKQPSTTNLKRLLGAKVPRLPLGLGLQAKPAASQICPFPHYKPMPLMLLL